MARAPREPLDLRSKARVHTATAINVLVAIAKLGKNEAARVSAAAILLDRGWGRTPQPVTGANGDGDIRITIRTIVEGAARDEPYLIVDNSGGDK